jgi:hypothetical protein
MLDQKYLLELFEYKDGELYWKTSYHGKIVVGNKAGTKKAKYSMVSVRGKKYYKHKIIFMMVHGYCPELISFVDSNPQNCKIENLKELTRSELGALANKRSDNTSGYKGVSWSSKRKKWIATLTKNNKRIMIGAFEDIESAYKAYCNSINIYHDQCLKINN